MTGKLKQLGQGMTEYIIIVALVAVAAITAYGFFGDTIRGQVGALSQELAGEDGDASRSSAADSAGKAVGEGDKEKNLSNYTQ
jgi:type IV pilus assembly protein PilA